MANILFCCCRSLHLGLKILFFYFLYLPCNKDYFFAHKYAALTQLHIFGNGSNVYIASNQSNMCKLQNVILFCHSGKRCNEYDSEDSFTEKDSRKTGTTECSTSSFLVEIPNCRFTLYQTVFVHSVYFFTMSSTKQILAAWLYGGLNRYEDRAWILVPP